MYHPVCAAALYEPVHGTRRTVLLTSGLHPAGINEPRLIALSPSQSPKPAAPVFLLHGIDDADQPIHAGDVMRLASFWGDLLAR
jgi:hypothetical protein